MLTRTEAERLAAMGNALRPDWPVRSLMTLLAEFRDRAYRDVAVAVAYIATDPQTTTPGRLRESGPWWRTTEEQRTPPVGRATPCGVHPAHPALGCPECKAIPVATPEQIAAARTRGRQIIARKASA